MTKDSCLDHFTDMGLFPMTIVLAFTALLWLSATTIYIYYINSKEHLPLPGEMLPKDTSYSISSLYVVKMLTGLGLAINIPTILFYYIFYNLYKYFHFQAKNSVYTLNSGAFACMQQNSSTGGLFSLVIPFVVIIILYTNNNLLHLRYKFANKIKSYLIPADDNIDKDQSARILILPVLRGLWVAPLLDVFISNMQSIKKKYQIYCLDDFNSKFNKESDDWFSVNMNIEGYASQINLVTSGFKSIPIIDNSMDVIVMPTGNFSQYLYQANNKEESEKKYIYQSFVNEIHRILRPGGRFISTRGIILADEWNEAFDTSLLERDTNTDKENFFISFVPSQIDIYRKNYDKFIPPSLDNKSNLSNNSKTSDNFNPMNNETKRNSMNISFLSSSNLGNDSSIYKFGAHKSIKKLEVFEQIRIPSVNELHKVEKETISRTQKLANFLILTLFCAWIFGVLVVWINLNYLEFPVRLGYDLMLSANCVSNLSTIPILMYYEFDKIMNAAIINNDAIKNTELGKNDSTISMDEYKGIKNIIEEKLAVKRVWRAYFNAWFEIGILVTVVSFYNWIPYVIIDLVAIYVFGLTSYDCSRQDGLNFISGIVLFLIFMFIIKPLYKLWNDRLIRLEKAAELEIANDIQSARETFASNSHSKL